MNSTCCARALGCACLAVVICTPLLAQDRDSTQRDSLTQRPITMQAVTITTTQPMRNEPVAAVHVSASVIRQSPALNAWDLLRQAAGLEVHDQGQGPGFASNASVRGFSSDHSTDLALWIDGVPINEPVNGHAEGYGDWSLLMPQAVSGIEVLKGPSSALYGNFAMAGVVNVRTLERTRGLELSLSRGAYGRTEGSLVTGLDREGTGGVFAVRGLREDGWRPNSTYKLGQAHGRWVHQLTTATTVDAGLELYAAGWDSPGFLTDSLFQLRRYDVVTDPTDGGFKRRAQERVSIRNFSGNRLWRTTLYSTQGRWQLFLTTPPEGGAAHGTGSQTEEEEHRHGFGATSALTWALPKGEVTLGVEGRWDRAHFERWFTTSRQRDSSETLVAARQMSGALFVQTSLDFGRHVRATVGGRFDLLNAWAQPLGGSAGDDTKGVLSPKFGLLVHVPVIGAIYGNVSRGFRQTDGVISNPSLPFITEWASEVGVKVDRGPLSASAALFRMDVSNEQTFNPVTLASSSGGASRRQGLELDAALRLAPALTLDANWTFNNARYRRLITEDGDTLDGARVFNTARFVGSAGLTIAPPDQPWHARIGGNIVGPYSPFDLPGVELPSYGLVHLSGGVRLGRGSLDVGVRNLLNRAYPELRAADFVAPGQPRSVFVSLRLNT